MTWEIQADPHEYFPASLHAYYWSFFVGLALLCSLARLRIQWQIRRGMRWVAFSLRHDARSDTRTRRMSSVVCLCVLKKYLNSLALIDKWILVYRPWSRLDMLNNGFTNLCFESIFSTFVFGNKLLEKFLLLVSIHRNNPSRMYSWLHREYTINWSTVPFTSETAREGDWGWTKPDPRNGWYNQKIPVRCLPSLSFALKLE